MAQTFLIFDFGKDEDAAQQARHRIDGWRQGFRLDKKLQLKFDRADAEPGAETETAAGTSRKSSKGKASAKAKPGTKSGEKDDTKSGDSPDLRLIVKLDFSDHEKLSHHRWVERIPSEDIFKDAKPKILRAGDAEFAAISERFDSLS